MKELFNLLNEREKKTLGVVAAAAAVFLLAFVFLSLGEWRSFVHSEKSLAGSKSDFEKSRVALEKAHDEWQRWEEARQDLEEFRTKYFYEDKEGMKDLRLDLERIFGEAGLRVSQISYNYVDLKKGKARKVTATFLFKGGYTFLKRFLAVVERFPKFLTIEKIDFLNTGSETGTLELKIELAGYYEI